MHILPCLLVAPICIDWFQFQHQWHFVADLQELGIVIKIPHGNSPDCLEVCQILFLSCRLYQFQAVWGLWAICHLLCQFACHHILQDMLSRLQSIHNCLCQLQNHPMHHCHAHLQISIRQNPVTSYPRELPLYPHFCLLWKNDPMRIRIEAHIKIIFNTQQRSHKRFISCYIFYNPKLDYEI